MVTRAGLGIDPNQIFADPDKADDTIASALLANAYTALSWDADAFKREFSDTEAGKVFNALFGGSTQSGDLSAVDNFGLGLGLTSLKKPREFDPAPCHFFTTIRKELTQAGGQLRLYNFYEKYTSAPYGLLEDMVTLSLLAFVRFAQPPCYLMVKTEAGLKLKTGNPPLDNLVQAVGPSWNDLVEFARIFDDSLKATAERQEVASQQDRLVKTQRQWHEKIEGLQPRLQRLAQATQGNITPYLTLLDQVDRVCCTTGLEEFEHIRYAQPLLNAVEYLEALEGVPETSALITERALLQARFALDIFCRQPSQAGLVLEKFEQFKCSYGAQYQIHYHEYRKQLIALETRLKKFARRVDGLAHMNQIEELGGGVGTELPS